MGEKMWPLRSIDLHCMSSEAQTLSPHLLDSSPCASNTRLLTVIASAVTTSALFSDVVSLSEARAALGLMQLVSTSAVR